MRTREESAAQKRYEGVVYRISMIEGEENNARYRKNINCR